MRKNPHIRTLRGESKEQYINIVLKSCPIYNIVWLIRGMCNILS